MKPGRENCVLNLGLYEEGVMCKAMCKAIFENKLSKCSNSNNIHILLAENSNYSALLIELLKETFSALSLKENQIQKMNTVLDDEVQKILENVNLETGLTGKETLEKLKDCTKLKTYLSQCSRARVYFFFIEKDVAKQIAQFVYPDVYLHTFLKS